MIKQVGSRHGSRVCIGFKGLVINHGGGEGLQNGNGSFGVSHVFTFIFLTNKRGVGGENKLKPGSFNTKELSILHGGPKRFTYFPLL